MKDIILVNLVSEQTIPNVQFIKWYFNRNKKSIKILLISTKEMEQKDKSAHIKKALACLDSFVEWEVIQTDGNDMEKTNRILAEHFEKNKYKSEIVNITGGTKLMSLAVFDFFKRRQNAEIYYQPIGKELQKLYPDYEKYDMVELLSLQEYLDAHGISYKFSNECIKDRDFNKSVYDLYIKKNRESIAAMNALQNNAYFKNRCKNKEFLDFTQIDESKFSAIGHPQATKENMIKLLQEFGFNAAEIKEKHIRYITGGWFEEYVYQKICNEYQNVDKKNAALNVAIQKGNDKNELDVIYLDKDNKLHVIECKSFVDAGGKEGNKVLNDALYKLQAIIKSKFGLSVKQHLYTKSIIDTETPLNRAKEFGIDIKDGREI
ncbi:MAG: DUF1887 family CARF protein [Bacteroides sp.]|nr:DUF1887 family CARF protein [Prevotella sp.]MCM1406945.1 DUF1887 family CARF protein [Treponema brennaborense]MCM1470096.1 DUF1887 family CARF protein [Bacteroides sp.]